ncbi:YceI family protein [Prauserella sp. PE36]|uniref:YceI family protein n=1 Tax=Prauserella sp. PE36 TaxID=1504709 RepID=UPI0013143CD7
MPATGESRWRVDPAGSRISFKARWMFGTLTAEGVFERFGGWALLREDGSLAGELSIDPSSVNTGIRLRDHHLQNRFFLDSANYPIITLASSHVVITSRPFRGVGSLSVRDRSVDVPIHGTAGVDVDQVILSGSATLDIRQFGWPTAFGYIGRSLTVEGAIALEPHG